MLILARKPGQAIVLPDRGITIRVLAYASCGQVRIGIEADQSVRILREEVADETQKNG
jgi:carbon storage regulator CsrA